MVFFLALILIFLVLAKRLAGQSISDMTCIVSSGTFNLAMLNLNSINQNIAFLLAKYIMPFCALHCSAAGTAFRTSKIHHSKGH